ncbi:hypothetical protein [Catenulispora rubra]|uniref:hypothetical protein n=1 Tax=Catenulispora rubra TaxID=280293 RepID=UPI00189278CE|nr:hypothetical protein [Catenulispora rubra]
MVIVFPAVFIFGALSWLLIRSRMIRPLEAVIVGLFGFFLATTGVGHEVAVVLDDMLGAYHTGPATPGPTTPSTPQAPMPAPSTSAPGGVVRL